MFIKKKVSFTEFNQVLNILDFIIANPEYSPYNAEDYPQRLRESFLKYSIIHFSDDENIRMKLTENENEEFNFLSGYFYAAVKFAYQINHINMITISYLCDGTDYIKQLQDKYNEWRTEKEKKEGNMS